MGPRDAGGLVGVVPLVLGLWGPPRAGLVPPGEPGVPGSAVRPRDVGE